VSKAGDFHIQTLQAKYCLTWMQQDNARDLEK